MSENVSVQEPVVEVVAEPNGNMKPEAPKESPAKDLRAIQALLVNGIFPGNVAPQVVAAFQLLESMAQVVEREATKVTK